MQAIILALVAAFAYGVSSPLAKVSFQKGMLPQGFMLTYGISLIIAVLFSGKSLPQIFPNQQVMWFGIISGVIGAIGFGAASMSLAIPTSICISGDGVSCIIPYHIFFDQFNYTERSRKYDTAKTHYGNTNDDHWRIPCLNKC